MTLLHLPGLQLSGQANRSSRDHGSILAPLRSLARRPAAILDHLFDDFAHVPSAEEIARQDLESKKAVLKLKLRQASTCQEWQTAALDLDKLEGNQEWKLARSSTEYDVQLVLIKLRELEDARLSDDLQRMLFLVRTSLTRYLGGMGNLRLYKHSHIGTKHLIEQYIDAVLQTITALLDTSRRPQAGIDPRHLLDQVLLARQAFGRSALLLSGGGTFGMNHNGVVKVLWEQNLLPRIVSGSSAGSIVCAVLCSKTDDELPTVLEEFCYGDLEVFTKAGEDDGILQQAARFLKYGAIFDIGNLKRVMRNILGDMTFQEAYNRTRRILNICVSSASVYELPRLLNYVTAPNVIIWSAVTASCSVPVIFSPAQLLAKDPRSGEALPWNPSPQSWIDGSVDSDLPMERLAAMFNVNHFIVSQVNPHVVPFLAREEDDIAREANSNRSVLPSSSTWFSAIANLARDEAMHRMHMMSELGILPNLMTKARSVLSQRYSGDINIFPEIPYTEFTKILLNPTTDFMLQATNAGERATWPKLSRIQNHCAIELALDDAVQQLRTRIAFSPSQVNLRLGVFERPASRAGSDSGRRRGSRGIRKRLRLSDKSNDEGVQRTRMSRPTSIAGPLPEPITQLTDSHRHQRRRPVSFMLTPRSFGPTDESSDGESIHSTSQTSLSMSESENEDEDGLVSSAGGRHSTRDLSTTHGRSVHLFPFASQPATPLLQDRTASSYFSPSTPLPLTSPVSINASSTRLPSRSRHSIYSHSPKSAIQSSAAPRSPGPRRTSSLKSNTAARRDPFPSSPNALLSPPAMDVSGTRGMMIRKKRSMTTGMQAAGTLG